MKYMNNHFGKSRIFGNARCKMPMNLQLFGYEGNGEDSGSGAGGLTILERMMVEMTILRL